MVTMTRNASYKNDLFSITSIFFCKGWKGPFSMQPLMDNCKTFFLARQNTIATFFT